MKTKTINTAPLAEFFEKEMEPGSIVRLIGDVNYRMARLALLDTEACGAQKDVVHDMDWLRAFRDAVASIASLEGTV